MTQDKNQYACVGGPMNGYIVKGVMGGCVSFPIRIGMTGRYRRAYYFFTEGKLKEGAAWTYLKYKKMP